MQEMMLLLGLYMHQDLLIILEQRKKP